MTGRYFWTAILGIFLGVALAELYPLGFAFAIFLAAIGSAIWSSSSHKYVILAAILFIAASGGILRVNIANVNSVNVAMHTYVGQKVVLIGRIVDEPDKRERTVRLTISPIEIIIDEESSKIYKAPRVLVPARLPAEFAYGDTVRAEGMLKKPESFDTDGARVFDYPNYLAARGIYYEMSFPEVERIEKGERSLRGVLFSIKQKYLSGLQRSLPEPHSSLAGGITVGDKRSLGEKLTDQFRRTGLVHIVVLSGYNITLIVGVLMLAIRNAPLTWRFILGGGSIIAFVLMTGASATGVRAGAMAVLALLAAASYRKYAIDRALAITALGMVLWNPHILLYDPGFQLSVIATLGLIHLASFLEKHFTWITKRFQLRSITAATIGTQIAVMPLLLYHMGLLSFVALPTNLFVLPAIPFAMMFSFIAGIAGAINSTFGLVVGIPAYVLLTYTMKATEFFAGIPLGSIEVPAFSGWFVVLVYAVALAIWKLPRSAFQQRSNSNS